MISSFHPWVLLITFLSLDVSITSFELSPFLSFSGRQLVPRSGTRCRRHPPERWCINFGINIFQSDSPTRLLYAPRISMKAELNGTFMNEFDVTTPKGTDEARMKQAKVHSRKNGRKLEPDTTQNVFNDSSMIPNTTDSCGASMEQTLEPKSKKAKASKASSSKLLQKEPSHWIVNTDQIVFEEISIPRTIDDSANVTKIVPNLFRFTVRGNPLPLRRHRTRLGFIYNPSAATQKSFRDVVEHIIDTHIRLNQNSTSCIGRTITEEDTDNNLVDDEDIKPNQGRILLWESEQPLAVSIIFRMKRPKSHFIGNKPGMNRLRTNSPQQMCTSSMRTDVDNLAKFVLDSLNGVVYSDDRQIVSLHVTKLYDNDGTDSEYLYQGSTCVCIRLIQDNNIPQILSTSMSMF
jgi:Endodeoxyribonuclease RusA